MCCGRENPHATTALRPTLSAEGAERVRPPVAKIEGLSTRLFAAEALVDAYAGTEIPAGSGEVGNVDAAVAVGDVAERVAARNGFVDFAILGLAGVEKRAGVVDDAGERGSRDAGAADDEEAAGLAFVEIGVDEPNAGSGIGVEGDVRSTAGGTNDVGDTVLEVGTRLVKARTTAGILPSALKNEIASGGAPRNGGAPGGDDVGRNGGPNGARAIPCGSEVNNVWRREEEVVLSFLGKLSGAPTHRDFAAAGVGHELTGELDGGEEIAEIIRRGFDQDDLRVGRHSVGILNVERFFELPTAGGIERRLSAVGVDDGEVGGRKAEDFVEDSEIRDGVGIVIGVDNSDHAGTAGGILGGFVGVAAGKRIAHEVVETRERSGSFKEEAGDRGQFAGIRDGLEGNRARIRNQDAQIGVGAEAGAAGCGEGGLGNHDVAMNRWRLSEDGVCGDEKKQNSEK